MFLPIICLSGVSMPPMATGMSINDTREDLYAQIPVSLFALIEPNLIFILNNKLKCSKKSKND